MTFMETLIHKINIVYNGGGKLYRVLNWVYARFVRFCRLQIVKKSYIRLGFQNLPLLNTTLWKEL